MSTKQARADIRSKISNLIENRLPDAEVIAQPNFDRDAEVFYVRRYHKQSRFTISVEYLDARSPDQAIEELAELNLEVLLKPEETRKIALTTRGLADDHE